MNTTDTKLGKMDPFHFDQLIGSQLGKKRHEVRIGAQFGVDVSVIELPGDMAMALTSDPLSLIPTLGLQESAWLSVHLMANDMATTGIAPMYGQFVLNLPPNFTPSDFKTYWQYIHTYCSDIGIAITGGHTGFIPGQNSTIAGGGTLISVAPKERLLVSRYGKPGDCILVTKCCALSSTAILALSFPQTVKNKLGTDIYQQAADSFYQTSSLADALTAVGNGGDVTAMHDVTEGGVLGALYELATASGCGAVIQAEALPIGYPQQQICSLFSLDPRYCIGAGSMLIACRSGAADHVIHRLKQKNIDCVEVGQLTPPEEGIRIIDRAQVQPIPYQPTDPYWEAFYAAVSKGWK